MRQVAADLWQGAWVSFRMIRASTTGKTQVYRVAGLDDRQSLGEVRWFGRWRKYAFFPIGTAVFEADCLRDIAQFCEARTKEHRA